MTESKEEWHCSGCGVSIQTEDPKKLGYAPESALKRDVVVCKRCYRLKHYNEIEPVSIGDEDFQAMFASLHHKKALIVKVVDVVDFYGSWISGIHRFVGKNPVLLVANKVDLLPKSTNRNKLTNWLKKSASDLGLKPLEVKLMSTITGEGIDDVALTIDEMRRGRDVYVVGCTNVGKSSFINRILAMHGQAGEAMITTSHFPGTTLAMIDIPLGDGKSLVDTPGLVNRHQYAHLLSVKGLKEMTPKKEIKPIVYQLKEGQTLFLGGLARFDFVKGAPSSFIVYAANRLHIHRTKLEKADDLYSKHGGELLVPPYKEDGEQVRPLVKHSFKVGKEPMDIVFSGLGWIRIQTEGAIVEAHAPKEVGVAIRRSIHT
ncbi:ribosome biogenesis GTPase YqeH [Shouchella clausii]|uniref:ribosome biogenesis GTPase YqeH n=1 Tax=Shouchella clausii TaxID=79880 RepID=UPI000BA589B4|nr:ribosome biogenesis GTPase YqeH [Shouchella clausii]PAD13074.1 ribosome biogenesis GTPase YqeH [Shouchella clausii]PTL21863.1 ribosome biogenesis GTPase YqeH [Shouchella clausii]